MCGGSKQQTIDLLDKNEIQKLHKAMVIDCSPFPNGHAMDRAFDIEKGITPVILLPTLDQCTSCNGNLKTDSRPSVINVIFTDGQKTGHCYHKKCYLCGMLFYYSISKKTSSVRSFYKSANEQEIFTISPKTAFSTLYLRQISAMIEVSSVTFQGISDHYLSMHDYILEKQRIEEAYFLFKLLYTYNSFNLSLDVEYNVESCRKDTERLCKTAVEEMLSMPTDYEQHLCKVPGCKEGFIMADGIEKVKIQYTLLYFK